MRAKSRAATTVGVHPLGVLMIGALSLVVAWFALVGSVAQAADSCSNAEFRTGHAANLPDCRAYEQVTPVKKSGQHGVFVDEAQDDYIAFVQASDDGSRAAYWSWNGQDSPAHAPFRLSTRANGGWSSNGIVPPHSDSTWILCIPEYVAFSSDLSHGVLLDAGPKASQGNGLHCGISNPPLVSGQSEQFSNLFLRDNAVGSYQLITPAPLPDGSDEDRPVFLGATPDLTEVVFITRTRLTPDAPTIHDTSTNANLYKWSADTGTVSYLNQVPTSGASCSGAGCEPTPINDLDGALGGGFNRKARAVSNDGARIFFTDVERTHLYLREGDTTTVVDAAQGGPGPDGGGLFQTATVDGSSVFFTSANRLTADASSTGADLYRYDVEAGVLTNLTPGIDPDGAHVRAVLGSAEDASRLYFAATGVLAPNQNSEGDTAIDGEFNLYELQGSAINFIATLASSDGGNWGEGVLRLSPTSRVTPDGTRIAFQSTRSLTGYDNTVEETGEPASQVYLYDAPTGELRCVSCNPSGARPFGASRLKGVRGSTNAAGRSDFLFPRVLSDDGSRLFFESYDALDPADTNAKSDVYAYEWESGELDLISTGRSGRNSFFADASASGDDVFFATVERLVGQDTDGLYDLYDARVDGGLASQNPPRPAPPCSGDACREGVSAPPDEEANGSAAFSGPGNPKANDTGCPRSGQKTKRLARKVKRAKRKLRRADGKRAKRQARRKLKQTKRRHKQAKRRAMRCERGDR